VKKPQPEALFELAHKAGNGRGRQPERSRGGRKTLPLDDPDERSHVSGGIHSLQKLINLVPE
jgi:hypothetical protein